MVDQKIITQDKQPAAHFEHTGAPPACISRAYFHLLSSTRQIRIRVWNPGWNMNEKKIYILTSCLDDPRFSGFEGEVEIFHTTFRDKKTWQLHVRRLADAWKTPRVKGNVRPINHYPCINLSDPAFSQHAADCLGDLLNPNGELLPLITPTGKYYFYNLLTVADVLDVKKSRTKWLREPMWAQIIEHHEFIAKKLKGLTIFRVLQDGYGVYVTDHFARKALSGEFLTTGGREDLSADLNAMSDEQFFALFDFVSSFFDWDATTFTAMERRRLAGHRI